MNNSPKISVIIPVFKADQYLTKILDAILTQFFSNWECLLIDDGSPDKSGRICDEYAEKDSRFRVFHKQNGGVSSARNLGIDKARGEWITFIDADDYISNNYFNAIENSSVDMVFTKSERFYPDSNECEILFSMPLRIITDLQELKKVLSEGVIHYNIFKTPWGKFIKRSLIGDTRFELGQKLGEDTIFIYKLYKDVTSIQLDNRTTYYWRIANSPDPVKYKLDVETDLLYLGRIYKAYKESGISNSEFECIYLSYFFSLIDRDCLSKDPQKWFSAPLVKEMEQYALPMWGTRKKFEYCLWKWPRIAKTYYSILDVLRVIFK